MDFSKGPGQEALFSALTYDPFTYPEDNRNANHGGAVNAIAVRRIGGQRILFLPDWPRNGEVLYRFNAGSEIAIPCGKSPGSPRSGMWCRPPYPRLYLVSGSGTIPAVATDASWTILTPMRSIPLLAALRWTG